MRTAHIVYVNESRRPMRGNGVWMFLLLLLSLPLSSCVSAMLDPGPPPPRLQLAPAMPARMTDKPVNRQIVVASPVSGAEIDNDRIALIFSGREVRYLGDARWTGSVPVMVRGRLIEALEATGGLRGVSDELAGLVADVRLLTDIKQFALHYSSEDAVPVAALEAGFRLLNLNNGRIMASRSVDIKVPAAGKDRADLAKAMEKALSDTLADIAPWVVEEMRKMR
jgi:ABC-type uncharacterized transport system, auxiliary component